MMLCRLLYEYHENVGRYFSERSVTSWQSTLRHIRVNFNPHYINMTVREKKMELAKYFMSNSMKV